MQTASNPLCLDLAGASVAVESLDADSFRTRDELEDSRDGETPFLGFRLAVGGQDLGVDQTQRFVPVLRHVNGDHPLRHVDLRCREADPRGVVHRLEHLVDQAPNVVVHPAHGLRPAPQARVGIMKNLEAGHQQFLSGAFPMVRKAVSLRQARGRRRSGYAGARPSPAAWAARSGTFPKSRQALGLLGKRRRAHDRRALRHEPGVDTRPPRGQPFPLAVSTGRRVTRSDPSSLTESDLLGWLAVARAGSCNGHAVLRAVNAFGTVVGLFEGGDRELAEMGFTRASVAGIRCVDWNAVRRERELLERAGCVLVPIGTSRYPARLAAIFSPPPVLYCRGDPEILDSPQIAVVGARAATRGGRERALRLAGELACGGLVVTSGLARGIDAAAHRGALDAGGRSVAVVATGLDRIYPRSNAGLAHELVEAGAVVTERASGTPPLPGNFPRRNRLISGLSLGVLVVEASLRSGSLITARLAVDEGREVFAVPGSVDSPLSRGCHALIRDGAKLVESIADVLEEIVYPGAPSVSRGEPHAAQEEFGDAAGEPAAEERSVLDAVGHDPVTLDRLVDWTGMPAGRLAATLLALEIDGRIEALPGGRYVRTTARR